MNNTIKFSVDIKNSGKRLDTFLAEKIKDYTRSYLKKLIEQKQVKLNNAIFISPSKKIKCNDQILINIEEKDILDLVPKKIKLEKKPVIFISGHFNNFELMAMHIEKSNINLAAVYRPLNNKFLNPIMERIRKKYICKKQIKKGISGTKELLKEFKNGTSIALMIDQRVSEGIKSDLFGKEALTTTIPAQFIKKFNASVVPIYIERSIDDTFKLKIYESIKFSNDETVNDITKNLNQILEKMIMANPDQWIWTHNRWKI